MPELSEKTARTQASAGAEGHALRRRGASRWRYARTAAYAIACSALLAVTLLSAEFTWAWRCGKDWLVVVRRGDLVAQVITYRLRAGMAWDNAYDPDAAPFEGLTRNPTASLSWHMPRLRRTYRSSVGAWWDCRVPLWCAFLALALPLGWGLAKRRRERVRPKEARRGTPPGSTPLLSVALGLTAASALVWLCSGWVSLACRAGDYVVDVQRCTLIVHTVADAEHYLRWSEATHGWDYHFGPFDARWELPHTEYNAQSTIGVWSELVIPLWFLTLASALPLAWLLWRRRRRPRPGVCGKCAYDLTGNVSGVCPECGTPIARFPSPEEGVCPRP